ncbi:unnamed protein product [Ceutorhynchus assimilis]|uniref:RRM domain-containing protein n=1 Tax=Ceutorhynchus assimilis TaxID=467358 RepID=A0A9P0DJA2_9CUCU|nr:unnamed protein product [Ceutorhynchus assimilis]
MVCKDTLRIKYLPKELSDAQKEDFVKHFGAHTIKIITSKMKSQSVVYAKFDNEDVAKNVISKLHQIEILNCIICVEYAEFDILKGSVPTQKNEDTKDSHKNSYLKTFINNLNAFNDSVNFYQPPPSHLKYNYPRPNEATLSNIAHALAVIPRFYTQVLHLMNRMNLPPPFADASTNTVPYYAQTAQPVGEKRKASSSESEMESDNEKVEEIITPKKVIGSKKMIKRPRLIKPPQVKTVSNKSMEKTENVFEKVPNIQPQRKIELNILPTEKQETGVIKNVTDSTVENQENAMPELKKQQCETEHKKSGISDNIKATEAPPKLVTVDKNSIQSQTIHPVAPNSKVQSTENESTNVINQEPKPSLHAGQNKDLIDVQQEKNILAPKEVESQSQSNAEAVVGHQQVSQDSLVQVHQMGILSHEVDTSADQILSEDLPCITLEELAANQITDISSVAAFKNYKPGEPTNKLYIKNCSKTVVDQDLEYIYNRYREKRTAENPTEFNIRLMQQGRMKGQAFVTLDSIELAEKAVKETNGFILKEKPLIVVFGKAGKKKEEKLA